MDLPDGGQHPNRTLAVGPDGKLYVTWGSTCNACAEPNSEHATILRLEVTGTPSANPANPHHPLLAASPMARVSPRVFASGLRNTLGFDWHPDSGALWGSDHGSDGLGDDVPPDELTCWRPARATAGPTAGRSSRSTRSSIEPREDLTQAGLLRRHRASAPKYPAHSAPIGFLFYDGHPVPRRIQGRRLRGLPGLLEPERPHRLQGRAGALHRERTGHRPAPPRRTSSAASSTAPAATSWAAPPASPWTPPAPCCSPRTPTGSSTA